MLSKSQITKNDYDELLKYFSNFFQWSCRWTSLTIASCSDISALMGAVFPLLGATAASATKDSN